jgi:hypothetical protein
MGETDRDTTIQNQFFHRQVIPQLAREDLNLFQWIIPIEKDREVRVRVRVSMRVMVRVSQVKKGYTISITKK